jgi:hypothetical protein
MDFYSVIDVGAFVWDKPNFQPKFTKYYALTALLIDFLEVMELERPKFLLRTELKNQIFEDFPWQTKGIPNFFELSRSLSAFLSNADIAEFDATTDDATTSVPNIVYDYYNDGVKSEVGHLVRTMHSNQSDVIYFTFCSIWDGQEPLETKKGYAKKQYETIVHCKDELQSFFQGLKPKFIHSSKHDKLIGNVDKERGYRLKDGKKIYPFSANYSATPNRAQYLLDCGIQHHLEPEKLYYWDRENTTYVCFMKTGGRVFHGYNVPEGEVHEPIRAAVKQKYDENGQR